MAGWIAALAGVAWCANTPVVLAEPQPAPTAGAAAPEARQANDTPTPHESELSAQHQPRLTLQVDPPRGAKVGELVHVVITAESPVGDDVTVADQSFAPFEVFKKQARVEPPTAGSQRFVFNLDLLAFEASDQPIPAIELRVVTKDNEVGRVRTQAVPFKVDSLLANEPNAQPKLETKPVTVLEDNYIVLYVLGGLLAAALVAGLTLLIARYLRRRKAAAVPPPPPRPPWEIVVEELAALRRRKQEMLDAGQGALFVDQLSHVMRAYLGGRYAFDGLETTTDEMLMYLQTRGASLGFTHEVGQFLGRSDLVKFAKVEPDADEVDLLFAKAQDLVHMSEPERPAGGAAVANVPRDAHASPERPSVSNGGGPGV
jgi:hypothetical protein